MLGSAALDAELENARILFLVRHAQRSRRNKLGKRIKRLEHIIKAAMRLKYLLANDDGALRLLDGDPPDVWLPRVIDRAIKATAHTEAIRRDTSVDEW